MKNRFLTTIVLALTTFSGLVQAYCLPSTVKVLDENGQYVNIDPALLEKNSPYKGYLVPDGTDGKVKFNPSLTTSYNPCYNDSPTSLVPVNKVVTIEQNTSIEIDVLANNDFSSRDELSVSRIVAAAANGRTKIKQGKKIKYTPSKDWCGLDEFSYELDDGVTSLVETSKVNVLCPAEPQQQELINTAPLYIAKVFDVNFDGLNDVYIQSSTTARVRDFYLQQGANRQFLLKANPTSSQQQRASTYSNTEIVVTRADYNGDGLLDFLVSSIDDYIWGAEEQLILAKRNQSSIVDKLVRIDEKFRTIRDFIEAVNRKASSTPVYVGLYNNTLKVCRIDYIPYYIYDSYFESWVVYYVPVYWCQSGRSFLSQYLKYDESFNYIRSLSIMDNTYGLNGFQGAVNGSWYTAVAGTVLPQLDPRQIIDTAKTVRNGVQIWRAGSVTATVILIADDISVVGVLNDVALIATVGSIGLAILSESALDYYIASMESNSDDIGVEDGDESVGAGTFAIPEYCDPRRSGQLPANGAGSSDRLSKNLKATGCWCDDNTGGPWSAAAHHIIPKSAGGEVGAQLRECLEERNIDIDSAINGVCLPKKQTDESNAFLHRGQEGNLHGQERLEQLLSLCKDSQYSNTEFENLLREIAEGYTKGIMLP